ncbi:MAG: hypothetical protein LJE69_01175 [Thiohalocapsa sp.]|uniref:hypothetical protein n=1 Tax=Thiohalocapsa sp. TaxID=2497641 RepID=UPI0025CD874F|nr:hypothetical protein [Thiohalocapsa sp.]MCG6939847.1 hypothetical protein [Thiohalocapsa sp.]
MGHAVVVPIWCFFAARLSAWLAVRLPERPADAAAPAARSRLERHSDECRRCGTTIRRPRTRDARSKKPAPA